MTPADSKPLRVALVMRPAHGGMRRHLETLLRFHDPARIAYTLFAPKDFLEIAEQYGVPYVPFHFAPRPSPLVDNRTRDSIRPRFRGNFDLLHAHGVRGIFMANILAQEAHIPSVFTAHNLLPPLPFLPRSVMRVFWRKITQMIAVSQAVATTFADNDIHAQQTEIIPNGVDLREFEEPPTPSPIRKQLKIPEGARIIVSAGRLAPEKGYDILIAAFRHLRLQNPHVHCLIVGDGDEEESLKQLGWGEKNLHFVGAVPNAIPYLQAADVVAVPSRMEGQGIVALEAMAAGKPVVATRVGGLVETVEEQITGTLVPPHDPFSLSNALSLLLTSPELCKAMGRAGRKRIESRYTAELMMRRTEDLYLRLTTQKAV